MTRSVEQLLVALGQLRGGAFDLYKPVIMLEFYEDDDVATVNVGRCKGLEEIVFTRSFTGADSLRVVLESALMALEASGAK